MRRADRVHADHLRALASAGRAKWRRAKACIPSMNDSSEPVDSRITRTPGSGLVAQRAGQREQHGHAGEVVVGARAPPRARRCRPSRPRSPRRGRRRSGAAPSGRAAPRRPPRAARPPRPTWSPAWSRRSRPASGSAAAAPAGSSGWNTSPEWAASWWAITTTVSLGVLGPDLRDHVRGGALGQERAPEPLLPAGDVVGHGRGREQPGRGGREAPEAARRPGRRAPVRMPDRPPVGAVRVLGLDAHARARLAQLLGDQLRRLAPRPADAEPRSIAARRSTRSRSSVSVSRPIGERDRVPRRAGGRLHLLQDRGGRAARRAGRRGRAHDRVHGHQPVDARARAGDPAQPLQEPLRGRPTTTSSTPSPPPSGWRSGCATASAPRA